MKRIIVNVPDEKLQFFQELMQSMGFNPLEEDLTIPEADQKLVLDRIKNSTRADYEPLEKVMKDLGIEL